MTTKIAKKSKRGEKVPISEGKPDAIKMPIYKRILKHYEFIIGVIIGLIPFIVNVTPINNLIHPIDVNPSSILVESQYDITSYFNVTNNSNNTLYSVQIEVDLPQGLSEKDVQVEKLSIPDDTIVNMNGIVWNTSVIQLRGYKNNHDLITLQLDRVLLGESNIIAFSLHSNAAVVSQSIKLSCVHYSKQPNSIISQ